MRAARRAELTGRATAGAIRARWAPVVLTALATLALLIAACGGNAPAGATPSTDDGSARATPKTEEPAGPEPPAAIAESPQDETPPAEDSEPDDSEIEDKGDAPSRGAGAEGEQSQSEDGEEAEAETAQPDAEQGEAEAVTAEDDTVTEEDEGPDPRLAFLIELTDATDVEVVARIGTTVAERRGLALLRPVPVYLLRRDDVAAYFDADDEAIAEGDEDAPPDRTDERVFQLLGIIAPEVSLDDLFRDLFEGLALGFYDFDLQGFVIISSNDHVSSGDISTITHEFVHVLQDQHFGVSDYFDTHDDNSDRILAARFVLEGDARTSEALFRDLESELAAQLEPRRDHTPGLNGSVPPLLQVIFNAPYFTGVAAIADVLANEGQAAVNALLADLPPSTEQLLHPEKRALDEAPLALPAPDVSRLLGDGWEALGHDTIGEFMLRTMLSGVTGGGVASGAAAGWGGDRLTVYRGPDDQSLLVWELRWDSMDDAAEAMAALRSWLPARTGAALEETGTELHSQGDQVTAWARREEDSVFVVIGEDAAAVDRVGLAALR